MATDTLIIIVVFASIGTVILAFILFRLFKYISSTSNPLPPPQPLAHERSRELTKLGSSTVSLLGDEEYVHVPQESSLPPPRPRHLSSHHTRPLSMSSMSSSTHTSGRRQGLPHSPHSQIQIILPAPLASDTSEFGSLSHSNSASTLLKPTSRNFLDAISPSEGYDRRSMVDRWLPVPISDDLSPSRDSSPNPQRRKHNTLRKRDQLDHKTIITATPPSPINNDNPTIVIQPLYP